MRLLSCAAAILLLNLSSQTIYSQEKPEKVTHIAGKTMKQWIKEIGSTDPSKRENAIRSVQSFGPDAAYEAVPAIIKELNKTPTPDTSVRVNGALALGVILGTGGAKDTDHKVVKDAVTILKRYLEQDGQQIVRYRAAQALGRIGPDAKDATNLLIAATKDSFTWETRAAAALSLGFVAREEKKAPSEAVIKALYAILGSGSKEPDRAAAVRLAAIQALTFLGAPDDEKYKAGMIKALEPLLTGKTQDPDPTVQIWAHMAIMGISREASEKHVDGVVSFLQNPEVAARVQAAQALGTLGSKAKRAVPALTSALADPEPIVVGWVIYALARMDNFGKPAIAYLEKLKADEKQPEVIRKAAQDAIDVITGKKGDSKKVEKK